MFNRTNRVVLALLLVSWLGATTVAGQTSGVSVVDHGAIADGRTDSTAAIQAAIDVVERNPTRGRVFIPAGSAGKCYQVNAPLRIRVSGVRLEGESYGPFGTGTCIRSAFNGPLIHITDRGNQVDLPLTSSLIRGPGRALKTSAATVHTATYVDLQDAGTSAQLNGLGAFTAELFFRLESNNPNYPTLWGSYGNLSPHYDGGHSAFSFSFDATLHLSGQLTVGGTSISINDSRPLRLGTVYHAAITYDGSTVRLFVGEPGSTSTLAGTTAATGPVTQSPFEMMPIGGRRSPWPRGEFFTEPVNGTLDSIRLSNTARYTSRFTVPDAKLENDANTLVLENFDHETIDWSIVHSSRGPIHLPKFPAFRGALIGNIEISHLELQPGDGSAIWAYSMIHSSLHDFSIFGGTFGFTGFGNFLNRFENFRMTSSPNSRLALDLGGGVSGITSIRNGGFSSWPVSIVADSGSASLDSLFSHGGRQIIPIVLRHGSYVMVSTSLSNEDADPATYVADLLLVDNPNVAVTGGQFERFVNAGPAILVDGGTAITLTAFYARPRQGATEVIKVLAPPANKILLLNGFKDQADVPWTTSTGDISVLP